MTSKTGIRSTRSKACNRFEEPWFSTPRWEWNAQDCPPGGTELKSVTDFTCSAFCWNVFVHRPSSFKNDSGTAVLHEVVFWCFDVLHSWWFLAMFDVRTVKYFPTSLFLALIWFAPQADTENRKDDGRCTFVWTEKAWNIQFDFAVPTWQLDATRCYFMWFLILQ